MVDFVRGIMSKSVQLEYWVVKGNSGELYMLKWLHFFPVAK